MIRLPRVLQVSCYLDTLSIYSTNMFERNRAHLGPFCATINPSVSGGSKS